MAQSNTTFCAYCNREVGPSHGAEERTFGMEVIDRIKNPPPDWNKIGPRLADQLEKILDSDTINCEEIEIVLRLAGRRLGNRGKPA